jgi:hypothetical protein
MEGRRPHAMFFADLPINDPERGSLRLRDRLTPS